MSVSRCTDFNPSPRWFAMFTDFSCLGNLSRLEVSTPPHTKHSKNRIIWTSRLFIISGNNTFSTLLYCRVQRTGTHTLQSPVGVGGGSEGRDVPRNQSRDEPQHLNALHHYRHSWAIKKCCLAPLRWVFVTPAAGTWGASHSSEAVTQMSTSSTRLYLPAPIQRETFCRGSETRMVLRSMCLCVRGGS